MVKFVIGIVAFFVIAIGLSTAYAETVDIPFEPQGKDCIATEDSQFQRFACVWVAEKARGISVFQDDLTADELAVLNEIAKAREDGTYVQPPRQDWKTGLVEDDNTERTFTNIIEQKACESEREGDKELCNHLSQLSNCEQAVTESESEPVSTYRQFTVSDGKISETQNFDLKDNQLLRDIYLKIEECYAIWQVLQPTVLGAQYLDFIRQSDDLQPYHADMTTREAIRTSQLTERSFTQTQIEAQNIICYYEFYDQRTKDLYNCPRESDFLVIKNPSGVVSPVSDEPLRKYLAYKDNPNSYKHDGDNKFVIINEIEGEFAIKVEDKD